MFAKIDILASKKYRAYSRNFLFGDWCEVVMASQIICLFRRDSNKGVILHTKFPQKI